ncbi:MAG: aspartate aminotransferase family protein [Deltaproteobacteria bacterium]|nr:aspartate aminotransferase family protein [Deltaproteobacteria bacterium]
MTALLDVYHQIPLEPVRGEGPWLFDAAGVRYLDAYGGHAVALLGYAHPRLLAALETAARTLFFQSNVVPLAVRERAAERLLGFAPPGFSKVFFVNSGAEANENALRVAFLATGRPNVVAVEGAFHGRTAGAAAVTAGREKWYGFPAAPCPVTWVPFGDVGALEAAVDARTAAVILEPVQGLAGARELPRSFLEAARRATERHGAVLVFDEVQCGMGRTGWPFAAQACGVTPDLLATAKGLAGGFPAGALLLRESLATCLGKGDLGTTFGGGPMAVALVETVVDVIESERLLERVRRLSARLRAEAVGGVVTAVQGAGFLLGLRTTRPAKDVLADLRARGILAGGAADPQVVRLLPPLILEDEHVDRILEGLRAVPA